MSTWSRMSREKKRVWGLVGSAIVVGTVLKVGFFKFSRGKLVEDAERKNREGMERLREAREFAKWSKQHREEQLPTLTEEQNRQLEKYLRLVEEHGWNKSMKAMQNGDESACEGCPVMNFGKNKVAAAASPK